MQNDMLKNNVAPWQEKGRWYHGCISMTSNPRNWINAKTDKLLLDELTVLISGDTIRVSTTNGNIRIMDAKMKTSKDYTRFTASSINLGSIFVDANGAQTANCGVTGSAGEIDVWFFIDVL